MKIKTLRLKNFRGYREETIVDFEDLTAFVGKNDIGKSTIMEALDIFFNDGKGVVKLDKNDINVDARKASENDPKSKDQHDITIAVCFTDLPENIIIDATNKTSLRSEYLLNENGELEIIKKYPNAGAAKIFIRALHPTFSACADLHQKKEKDLRALIEERDIPCTDKKRNSEMRAAIWKYYSHTLQLAITELDVTKGETKSIWEKLQGYLPVYSLFQSDRKNSDGDSEIQDPLKEAVKEILRDASLQRTLDEVAGIVEEKLQEVSKRTLEKLQEMSPEIVSTLNPVIPSASSLKWADVFKNVSIAGDDAIPINKRGSGCKRLILLNFFRAEVERRQQQVDAPSVVYAIEEPETAQHSDNQRKLIRALISLSKAENTQVIITTHNPTIVKELKYENLRVIRRGENGKTVEKAMPSQLPYVSLNEVNYLAFSEITEEYHNELYGYLDEIREIFNYFSGKPTVPYTQVDLKTGKTFPKQKPMTEYIRHQIHHPENKINRRFTHEELRQSIEAMRAYIDTLNRSTTESE